MTETLTRTPIPAAPPRDAPGAGWPETVRLTTLDNGLVVATDRMPALATVTLGAWIGVGSRHESDGAAGIAHLLEHMMFKGTPRRSACDIAESMEAVGGWMNAYTSRETTAYYAKCLAEDLPLAVDLLADMLGAAALPADELERERDVVLAEIAQARDTPDDIIFDHFQQAAYPGQALGRPVLGEEAAIGALPRDSLAAFMRRYYGARNMVLVAAGAVEHEAFVAEVAGALGALPAGEPAPLAPALYGGGEYRAEEPLEQAHLLLGWQGVGYHDPDFHAAAALATALGGGMSSRLFQELRERRGLVYSVFSFPANFVDDGLFGIYAGTAGDKLGELVPLVASEMAGLAAGDLDAAELARAQAQLRAGVLMAREGTTGRAEQLGHQLLIHGRPIPAAETLAHIETVSAADIRRVAGRLLASPLTLAALGPVGALESCEAVAARLAG